MQTLAAIGPELVAIGVREVRYGSIYRNTNVRAHGATKPILSRHALGIAMDIKAFVDEDVALAIQSAAMPPLAVGAAPAASPAPAAPSTTTVAPSVSVATSGTPLK